MMHLGARRRCAADGNETLWLSFKV